MARGMKSGAVLFEYLPLAEKDFGFEHWLMKSWPQQKGRRSQVRGRCARPEGLMLHPAGLGERISPTRPVPGAKAKRGPSRERTGRAGMATSNEIDDNRIDGTCGVPAVMSELTDTQRSTLRDFYSRASAEIKQWSGKATGQSMPCPVQIGPNTLYCVVFGVLDRNLVLGFFVRGSVAREAPPTGQYARKMLMITSAGGILEDTSGFVPPSDRTANEPDLAGVVNEELALEAIRQMNARDKQLAWAKTRALEYVEMGDLITAHTALGSDLLKEETTRDHPGVTRGMQALMDGGLNDARLMRDYINDITFWKLL
jgi:hypothetical protein